MRNSQQQRLQLQVPQRLPPMRPKPGKQKQKLTVHDFAKFLRKVLFIHCGYKHKHLEPLIWEMLTPQTMEDDLHSAFHVKHEDGPNFYVYVFPECP